MKKLRKSLSSLSLLAFCCTVTHCGGDKTAKTPQTETTVNATQSTQPEVKVDTMATNKKTFDSGLIKETLKAAPAGAKKPQKGDIVTVHYTGWLLDGGSKDKPFDSSVKRGEKFEFTIGVGQVIKGWDQGVMDMEIGETALLTIPASIGYGSRGAGNVIPSNATLVFEVELFDAQ